MRKSSKMVWSAGDTKITQCLNCKHWIKLKTCTAFPSGIPWEILINEFDHTQPYPGDNGIQFEAINDSQNPGLRAATSEAQNR